jgi:hypothetical protein
MVTFQLVACALLALTADAFDAPSVRLSFNTSNLYGGQRNQIGQNETEIEWVLIFGHTDTLGDCQKLCVEYKNATDPAEKCHSFTYFATDQRWGQAGGCYGRTDPAWSLIPGMNGIANGFVEWPCEDEMDCSLNGKCAAGTCTCNRGWKGKRCEILKLAPIDRKKIGFDPTKDGKNMSSWGGSVQQVEGKWHMWAVELANHCGIGSYLLNSGVVHAISEGGVEGPYTQADTVYKPFCHEPVVVRAPTGELVMASVNGDYGTNFSACQCVDGSTSKTCIGCNNSCFNQVFIYFFGFDFASHTVFHSLPETHYLGLQIYRWPMGWL